MMDGMIVFRSIKNQRDVDGVARPGKPENREVFARVQSVTRAEFFGAGKRDFKPEFVFTVFHDEYRGEDVCEYEGQPYAIYRTFRVPDTDDLELYAKQDRGVSNGT